jgi:two-component system sensor histidine kinase/response regulator
MDIPLHLWMRSDETERTGPSNEERVINTPVQRTGSQVRPPAILIVDDNPAKRLSLRAALEPLGFDIVEAGSGVAALRCVTAQDFAVILLDVRMPNMDGFETAAHIRKRRQSEMTPIIFITAHARTEVLNSDLYVQGAVDVMFPPVPPVELRAKVSVFANLFIRAEDLAQRARDVQTYADQLTIVTDASPIGIFQVDAQKRYVYANPGWAKILGIPCDQAIGQAWDHNLDLERLAGPVYALDDGAPVQSELGQRFKLSTPGGVSRIILVTSKSIPDGDGGIAGWVGTVADVSADAWLEEALADARDKATEASRLKSNFLANMSHEIRTPMNGVIGMTAILLETDLDARQHDYVETVRISGEALLTIIDDILDFSKVEAGMLEIENIPFSVRDVVGDVLDLLAGSVHAKGLELIAALDDAVPSVVSGDPGRVRQVLTNLIGNAVKFTPTGEVVVRVAAEQDGEQIIIRFDVMDTGDGIAPTKLESIFAPFVQADTSDSRKYGGTGLGLAISSQLVAIMGGRCGVSSQLGEGSDFWFTIRVSPVQGGTEPPPVDADLSGVTVLVVDDNATSRLALSGYLRSWGMAVTTADSGEAGLAALRDQAVDGEPFAVTILDHSMPEVDDRELATAIGDDPAIRTRLVVMTGLGQEPGHLDAAASGVCATLSKPVHPEALLTSVRTALGLADVGLADERPVELLASTDDARSGRVLLAEDNAINQKVAVAMLSGAGYHVDTVSNGAEAVAAFAIHPYDLILMDCQMPELNGYEATAAIRASEGSGRHIPIIAMTAAARQEDRERCLAEGMDSYLAKPVNKATLLALVGQFVDSGSS